MTDPTLFDPNEIPEILEVPVVDQDKDFLTELVGDGKKFKTPADLARAKAESDAFIERLKTENAEIRKDLNTRIKYEEFLDRMKTLEGKPSGSNGAEPPVREPVVPNQITDADLDKLVDSKLSAREAERVNKENLSFVKEQLVAKLGADYASKLTGQANELGLNQRALDNLAATNPKAFLRLFGLEEEKKGDKKETLFSPPRGANSAGMNSSQNGVKNYKYYQELRKKEPVIWHSVHTQNEMHKEALRQGEAFYSE